MSIKQKSAIGILAVIILASAVLFRGKLSSWLTFRHGNQPAPSGPAQTGTSTTGAGVAATLPKYTGRPPAEIRPTDGAIKDLTAIQTNQLFAAIKKSAETLGKNPADVNTWLTLGLYKKFIGDYEGARDAWEYASTISPNNYISFHNLGELYWHFFRDIPKAEINLKAAITNGPAISDSYFMLAEIYRTADPARANLAEGVLLDGLKKNPNSRDFIGFLALYYEETDAKPKAIEYYQKLLAFDPNNKEIATVIERLKAKTTNNK